MPLAIKYKCRSVLCKSMTTGWHSNTAEISSQLTKQTAGSNVMIFQFGSKYKLIRSLFSYIYFPSRRFRGFQVGFEGSSDSNNVDNLLDATITVYY